MAGFKRKIFYVSGFDPRGVRFYHQLLREQILRYAVATGEDVSVSPRKSAPGSASRCVVHNSSRDVETDYVFLRWEDIVQKAWIKNPLRLGLRAVRTYAGYIRHLDFPKGWALPRGPIITLFYPAVLTILLPILLALPVWGLASIWLPWWLGLLIGLAAGIAGSIPLLGAIRAPWLMRFFIFNGELSDGTSDPALDERLDQFAEAIAAALDEPVDEFLLITHSNGAILAMPLMEKVLERRGGVLPAHFSLVTLGHCMPLIACRRDATAFRGSVRMVGAHDFHWLDLGSPPDGAAYSGVDPVKLVGGETKARMDLLSPRFHKFYNAETYHKGWGNKYEIHFDYLRMGDHLSPLDYPSIVAGARPIAESVAAFKAIG